MENVLFTPVTLWEGFDYNLPLETTVLKEYDEDGVSFREVYCSGREIGESRVRVYGQFAYPKGQSALPCILLLGDCDKGIDPALMKYVCGRGYCVFMPDYSGEKEDCTRFTVYPQSVDYANYCRSGRHLEHADLSARETCWYEWTAAARCALTQALAMPECSGRAGVMGFRRGGLIAWHMAAVEDRISAAGSAFFAGWERYRGVYKYGKETALEMDDEMRKYLAGIAVESYAAFLKVPFLYLSSTNDTCTDMDRAFDTLARVPQDVELLYAFSPRLYQIVGQKNSRNMELFFCKYLKDAKLQLPPRPQLSAEREGDELVFTVRCEGKPTEVAVYVNENQPIPASRNWVDVPMSPREAGVWQGVFRPVRMDGRKFAYPLVSFADGFTASGNFFTRDFGESTAQPQRSNVLYMSSMGEDSFTCYMTEEETSLTRIFLSAPMVHMVNGPMNIRGVSNTVGGLATYKFSDDAFRGGEDNLLRFDVYSAQAQRLKVFFYEHKGMPSERCFEAEYNLLGGEIWQPLECRPSDFKTADGFVMKDWTHITLGCFRASACSIAINNLIWV